MGENQKAKMSPLVIVVLVLVSLAAVIIIAVGGIFLLGMIGQAKTESDAKSKEDTFIAAVASATALKDPVDIMKASQYVCGRLADPAILNDTPGVKDPFIVVSTRLYMGADNLPIEDAQVFTRLSIQAWCPQFTSIIPTKN